MLAFFWSRLISSRWQTIHLEIKLQGMEEAEGEGKRGVAHVPRPSHSQFGVQLKFPSKDMQLRGMSDGRGARRGEMCWIDGELTILEMSD